FRNRSCAGSYGWTQIHIQTKEGRSCAGRRIELLIQQWHELISNFRIPEESSDLPPEHATEEPVIKRFCNRPRNISNNRSIEKKDRFRCSQRRHVTIVGVQQNKRCYLIRMR